MTRTLAVAAFALGLAAQTAHAACSQADLQAKADEMTKRIQALAAKDPQKAQRWSAKVQEASQKLQEAMQQPNAGLEPVCRFYEALLAEMEKS